MIKKAVVRAGLTPDLNSGKPGWFIKKGEAVRSPDVVIKEFPEVPVPELNYPYESPIPADRKRGI
jgi:hypothetical protein